MAIDNEEKQEIPRQETRCTGLGFEAETPITIIYHSSTSLGATEFQHPPETNPVPLNKQAAGYSETLKHNTPHGVGIKTTITWAVLGQSRPQSTAL